MRMADAGQVAGPRGAAGAKEHGARAGVALPDSGSKKDGAGGVDWAFLQSFGNDAAGDDDLVTSMAWSRQGGHAAVGDASGRVCVLKDTAGDGCPDMRFSIEFHSHSPAFDSLTGRAVRPAVGAVAFLDGRGWRRGPRQLVVAANARTAKLWALCEDTGRVSLRRTLWNGPSLDMHSVAPLATGEDMLTADELCVRAWNLERGEAAVVLDGRPPAGVPVTGVQEVLTTAATHSERGHLFLAGSSSGVVRLFDMRERLRLSVPAAAFLPPPPPPGTASAASAAAASAVSGVDFAGGEHLVISRDFFALSAWDARAAAAGPVALTPVHEFLRPYTSELLGNGCLFDTFSCGASPDGSRAVTGSYDGRFVVAPVGAGGGSRGTELLCARDEADGRVSTVSAADAVDATRVNLARKSLFTSWHPEAHAVAVCALNKVFFFAEARGGAEAAGGEGGEERARVEVNAEATEEDGEAMLRPA